MTIATTLQLILGVILFCLGIGLLIFREESFKFFGVRKDTIVATDSWFKWGNWYVLVSFALGLIGGGLSLVLLSIK